jgi:hypothetical protein
VHNFLSQVHLNSAITVVAVSTGVELHVCKLSPLCITSVDKSCGGVKPRVEHMIERVSPRHVETVDNFSLANNRRSGRVGIPVGLLTRLEPHNYLVSAERHGSFPALSLFWTHQGSAAVNHRLSKRRPDCKSIRVPASEPHLATGTPQRRFHFHIFTVVIHRSFAQRG